MAVSWLAVEMDRLLWLGGLIDEREELRVGWVACGGVRGLLPLMSPGSGPPCGH